MIESRFLPSSQISGEDLQYRCFSYVYDVKSVSQPDTMALLGNNYLFQMTDTGFAEKF